MKPSAQTQVPAQILEVFEEWTNLASAGWKRVHSGEGSSALECFERANDLSPHSHIPPIMQLTRNASVPDELVRSVPVAEHITRTFPFNDWMAFRICCPAASEEAENNLRLSLLTLDRAAITRGVESFLENYQPLPGRHGPEMAHTMVLSTGRCGTVSLHRLFGQSSIYLPYHVYHFNLPYDSRLEMQARLFTDRFDCINGYEWEMTRRAEWFGAALNGKRIFSTNHEDTIFAPIFSAANPKGRFIHLKRGREAVFRSFYAKEQWSFQQLHPLWYTFDEGYVWRVPRWGLAEWIAWHIKATHLFCSVMQDVMGDRFIEISARSLFSGTRREIDRLIDFTELDLPSEQVIEHFATRINAKDEKVSMTERMIENGLRSLED